MQGHQGWCLEEPFGKRVVREGPSEELHSDRKESLEGFGLRVSGQKPRGDHRAKALRLALSFTKEHQEDSTCRGQGGIRGTEGTRPER